MKSTIGRKISFNFIESEDYTLSSKVEKISSRPFTLYSNDVYSLFSMGFKTNSEISAYESLLTINNPKFVPKMHINIYAVTLVGSALNMIQWQVMSNGVVRSGTSIPANVTVLVELFLPH